MNVRPVFEVPWERKGVLSPGLPILPHGVERHPVPGGGSRAVPIYKGDEVIVLDREGLQQGELVMFGPDRRSDAGMLGARGIGRPTATIETLANGSRSGAQVLKALAAAGFNIETGDGIRIFPEGSNAGDQVYFTAQTDGLLICAAPGAPMSPEAQNPPTELILYLRRADPKLGKGDMTAPDPLADPLVDFNINPGEAFTYEVKGRIHPSFGCEGSRM